MSRGVMHNHKNDPVFTTKTGQAIAAEIRMRQQTEEEQASLDCRNIEYGIFDFRAEGHSPYSFRVPINVCLDKDKRVQAFKDRLPLGLEINDEDGGFWNAVLALSFAPEYYPTFENDYYFTTEGSWYRGSLIANFRAEIVSESKTQFNETVYRVRANGKYFDVLADDLLTEKWVHLAGPQAKVEDCVQLYMEIRREWRNRSEAERTRLHVEELKDRQQQLQREIDAKVGGVL